MTDVEFDISGILAENVLLFINSKLFIFLSIYMTVNYICAEFKYLKYTVKRCYEDFECFHECLLDQNNTDGIIVRILITTIITI